MKLGIVGSEASKFTEATERSAILRILGLFRLHKPSLIVSGGCHLGGIDQWAVEEANCRGISTLVHLPKSRHWSTGYKERNIKIAEDSDLVVCITVKELPEGYTGMRFPLCYHCNTTDHVKSGGCWTVKYAKGIGKKGEIHVI